jgi:hypothetical protein
MELFPLRDLDEVRQEYEVSEDQLLTLEPTAASMKI